MVSLISGSWFVDQRVCVVRFVFWSNEREMLSHDALRWLRAPANSWRGKVPAGARQLGRCWLGHGATSHRGLVHKSVQKERAALVGGGRAERPGPDREAPLPGSV